jgi:ubiquinone/menaquinone biosynthesis C-methylase UbiE
MGTALVEGELWGAHAEDWAFKAEPTTKPLWQATLRACEVGPGTQLLDVGCGAGGLSALAASMGAAVHGLDASAALIEIARRQAPSGAFDVGDVESLPYPQGSFDVVTACNVLQFAGDRRRAVREVRRVLKPGGKFGIGKWCEPEACQTMAVFRVLMALAPPPEGGPPSLNQLDNLVELVESGGFEVASAGEVECVFDFPDPDEAWNAMRSAGVAVAVARVVGEETLRSAAVPVLETFKCPDGRVRMVNHFRYLVCG